MGAQYRLPCPRSCRWRLVSLLGLGSRKGRSTAGGSPPLPWVSYSAPLGEGRFLFRPEEAGAGDSHGPLTLLVPGVLVAGASEPWGPLPVVEPLEGIVFFLKTTHQLSHPRTALGSPLLQGDGRDLGLSGGGSLRWEGFLEEAAPEARSFVMGT